MIQKNSKKDLFNFLYPFIVFSSLAVFLLCFILCKIEIKPFNYFILVIIIVFSEGEIVKYFLKKEMLFFRIHVEYNKEKPIIRFERFLYLVMDFAIILLLILYIYFKDRYIQLISLIDKDSVRGFILFILLTGICASALFWTDHFLRKHFSGKDNKQNGN